VSQVLLAGDLSVRDPGDDALVSAFGRGLPEHELVLLTSGPSAERNHRGHSVVSLRDRSRALSALRRAQILILGDGALHGAQRPGRGGDRIREGLRLGMVAKALGRRVALLGVGAGALERGADQTRASRLVRLADLLILRDPITADVLAAAGAPGPFRVAADPVWCGIDTHVAPDRGRDGVTVILDADTLVRAPAIAGRLAAAADRLAAGGLRVRLAPWRVGLTGTDDLDLARTVAAGMGAHARVLLPPADLAEAQAEAARARVVLGLRRQALIVAAGAGTPAVALAEDHETASLARRLGQVSLPAEAAPDVIATAVSVATGHRPPGPEAVAHERGAAHEAFRLLRLLLEADRSEEDRNLAALPLMPEPSEPAR
jgi:polysaccharide pyruvyl transferase WcaK-like protein